MTLVIEAESAPAEDVPPPGLGFEKWMGFLSNVIAPATLLTGLLFYFGYVSSRSFFLYFGVDVDVLDLTNQQFVMRSPGALFIPVMVLLLLAAGIIVAHRLLRRRLVAAAGKSARVVSTIAWTGIGLLLAGLALAFAYALLATWPFYGFATASCLAIGAGLAAYAASTARALSGAKHGRALVVLLVAVMVAGTFWATAAVAEWWGRGQARALAGDLTTLPAVVLDTRERLAPGNAAITVTMLQRETDDEGAVAPGQFAFRYHGLRLLVRGGDQLFLVPDTWSKDASTLVVPFGDDVRLRFRFFPDADPPH
jgi:hypothetical protein